MKNITMCFIYWNKLNYKVYLFFFFTIQNISIFHKPSSILQHNMSVYIRNIQCPSFSCRSPRKYELKQPTFLGIFKVELKFGFFFYMFVRYYQSMFTFKTQNDILCSHVFTCSCIKTLNSLMFCFRSCYHKVYYIVLLYLCS